jgi:ubiquinone/menaquinone biosynthesis C-methylase UbiE
MAGGYDRMITTWERLLFELSIARARAQELGRDVDLRLGDAQALSFASESFDTVVVTLALCAIPNDRQVIREVARVLRPDGRLV